MNKNWRLRAKAQLFSVLLWENSIRRVPPVLLFFCVIFRPFVRLEMMSIDLPKKTMKLLSLLFYLDKNGKTPKTHMNMHLFVSFFRRIPHKLLAAYATNKFYHINWEICREYLLFSSFTVENIFRKSVEHSVVVVLVWVDLIRYHGNKNSYVVLFQRN